MRNEQSTLKVFSREQAKVKAESYCAYQERSQFEVRNKLYEWGLHQKEVEEIIMELIGQNFLNEERFAMAYTLGKFRIKGWGQIKIRHGLKLKRIPDKLITKSLKAIDEEDYLTKLIQILKKKFSTTTEKDPFKLRYLLTRYAASKGYEQDLITELLINNTLDLTK